MRKEMNIYKHKARKVIEKRWATRSIKEGGCREMRTNTCEGTRGWWWRRKEGPGRGGTWGTWRAPPAWRSPPPSPQVGTGEAVASTRYRWMRRRRLGCAGFSDDDPTALSRSLEKGRKGKEGERKVILWFITCLARSLSVLGCWCVSLSI